MKMMMNNDGDDEEDDEDFINQLRNEFVYHTFLYESQENGFYQPIWGFDNNNKQ